MNTGRVVLTGKTRVCPHCKSTILESSSVCPACQHHLRFDPKAVVERRMQATFSALRVEGGFKHPVGGDPWEYSVVISVRNDRGEEVSRQVVGVGVLGPNEGRTVTVSVDVFTGGQPVPGVERREPTAQRLTPEKKDLPEPQRSLQNLTKGPTKPLK